MKESFEGACVDFLFVYIAEAHAMDEWPVGDPVRLQQTKCLDSRLHAARAFQV